MLSTYSAHLFQQLQTQWCADTKHIFNLKYFRFFLLKYCKLLSGVHVELFIREIYLTSDRNSAHTLPPGGRSRLAHSLADVWAVSLNIRCRSGSQEISHLFWFQEGWQMPSGLNLTLSWKRFRPWSGVTAERPHPRPPGNRSDLHPRRYQMMNYYTFISVVAFQKGLSTYNNLIKFVRSVHVGALLAETEWDIKGNIGSVANS